MAVACFWDHSCKEGAYCAKLLSYCAAHWLTTQVVNCACSDDLLMEWWGWWRPNAMSLTSLVKPLGIAVAVFAASGRQWSCSLGALSAASVGSSCQGRDPEAAIRSSHQGSDPAVAGGGVLALAPRLYLVPALRPLLLCCRTCPLGCVLQVAVAAALRERHNSSRTDAGPLLPMALRAMSGSQCLSPRQASSHSRVCLCDSLHAWTR